MAERGGKDRPVTKHGVLGKISIWVRVPAIIALVLVGIVISAMLLDTAGGGHGRSGTDTETGRGGHVPSDTGGHGPGNQDRGGGHGSGDETARSDHNQGLGGSPEPALRDMTTGSARLVTFAMQDIVFVPATAESRHGGRA